MIALNLLAYTIVYTYSCTNGNGDKPLKTN